MRVVRRVLQILFGLLCLLLAFSWVFSQKPDYAITLPWFGFFVLIILILGPWWPNEENTSKWKLRLPTDDPRIAFPLLGGIVGLYAFYKAWDTFSSTGHDFHRFEKIVAAFAGPNGVAVAWVLIGIGCIAGMARAGRGIKDGLTSRSRPTR